MDNKSVLLSCAPVKLHGRSLAWLCRRFGCHLCSWLVGCVDRVNSGFVGCISSSDFICVYGSLAVRTYTQFCSHLCSQPIRSLRTSAPISPLLSVDCLDISAHLCADSSLTVKKTTCARCPLVWKAALVFVSQKAAFVFLSWKAA